MTESIARLKPDPVAGRRIARPRPGLWSALGALRSWLSIIVFLLAWYAASAGGWLNPRTFPGPDRLLVTAWAMVQDGSLPHALLVSLSRVVQGALLGLAIGLATGVFAGFSRLGEDIVDKPMQMLRTIPFTALVPLFILWFGIDETPKVLLVAFGVAVPMYINTFGGIRNVDDKLVEVARVARMSPMEIAVQVLLPAALPSLLVGLRFALGLAWVAVIIAETVGADSGIGFLLTNARQFVRTDIMLVCVAVYALLGLATGYLVRLLERLLLSWRRVYTG